MYSVNLTDLSAVKPLYRSAFDKYKIMQTEASSFFFIFGARCPHACEQTPYAPFPGYEPATFFSACVVGRGSLSVKHCLP